VQLARSCGGTPALTEASGPAPHRSRHSSVGRRSGCFCTRGAMQGYNVVLFILAMAKTPDDPSADGCQDRRDTMRGSPAGGEPGRTMASATRRSSLVTQLSRHGATIAYTDLLAGVQFLS